MEACPLLSCGLRVSVHSLINYLYIILYIDAQQMRFIFVLLLSFIHEGGISKHYKVAPLVILFLIRWWHQPYQIEFVHSHKTNKDYENKHEYTKKLRNGTIKEVAIRVVWVCLMINLSSSCKYQLSWIEDMRKG